jgi:hypothetical protein
MLIATVLYHYSTIAILLTSFVFQCKLRSNFFSFETISLQRKNYSEHSYEPTNSYFATVWCLTYILECSKLCWHELINYIDTKAKYHQNLPVKGLCGRCLSEFIDWRYFQSYWYFLPSCVNCYPCR